MHARPRSRRISAVAAAFAIVVASLVTTAGPASAAVCDDTTSDLTIGLNSEPGSTTTLRLVSGTTLFLDGALCAVANSVTVFDFEPDASAEKVVVIDATEAWGDVFLNLVLEIEVSPPEVGATYDVRILTSDAGETVSLTNTAPNSGLLITRNGGGTQLNGQVVNSAGNIGDPINWDFHLGGGDDTLELEDERFVSSLRVNGDEGDDTLIGTSGDDVLLGGDGDDDLRGLGGDDDLRGQGGEDAIRGGGGDDDIKGGNGPDTIFGNAGDDIIRGNAGDDVIRGGGGEDTGRGGRGADDIRGNGGADNLFGNGGPDILRGGGGDDVLNGGKGPDELDGNAGTDTCNGCNARDTVRRIENV